MITLNKLIKEPNEDVLKCLRYVHQGYQIGVPTEFVVDKPQYVVPVIARVYHTYLYWNAESNEALDNIQMAEGKRYLIPCELLLMVEVWSDRGDDGHVDYRLHGWKFVTTSTLTNDMDKAKEGSYEKIPECMTTG